MKITKWGEYGILCTILLGLHEKEGKSSSMTAANIAELQAIPLQYTHQILQRLRKGEIIKSIRGPKGGFQLTRAPEEISVKDILEASEGSTFEIMCETNPPYGDRCGPPDQCALSSVWSELKKAIDDVLEKRSLASLMTTHTFVPGKKNEPCQLVSIQSSEVQVTVIETEC